MARKIEKVNKKITWVSFFTLIFLILLLTPKGYGNMDAIAEDEEEEKFLKLRAAMVREQIADPPDYRDPVIDKDVISAMLAVPRHKFVRAGQVSRAYGDYPLPIGYGQTISQPYVVALMTDLLDIRPEHRVLEVGTGSGYQAAILSYLVKEVFTVEIVKALGQQAAERLRNLDYDNIQIKIADGYFGWKENAPYDRIIVTCAATLVPPPLLKQLKPGGKMCIPVGSQYAVQYLTMVEKSEKGEIKMKKELPVRFVPLTRELR